MPSTGEDSDARFVVLLAHAKPELFVDTLVRAHVAHLERLEDEGTLELAGPFADRTGGMYVLKDVDADEARRIAESDPFVSSGAETFVVRPWTLSRRSNNHLGMGRGSA